MYCELLGTIHMSEYGARRGDSAQRASASADIEEIGIDQKETKPYL